MNATLLVDAGQSGTRALLTYDTDGTEHGTEHRAEARGVDLVVDDASLERTVAVVADLLRDLGAPRCPVTAIGSTGFSRRPELNARLAARVTELTGGERVVLAADAVTSHLGALAGHPGVVAAVGTGVVVCVRGDDGWLGTLDGYGGLLGDRGGGYFLGVEGLRHAARRHDLVGAGEGDPLLAAACQAFGPVREWSSVLSGTAATARIASFATTVLTHAAAGDEAAVAIRSRAARELAETVAAGVRRLPADLDPVEVSWAGAVLGDAGLRAEFLRELDASCPRARPRPPRGTAVDGTRLLAADRTTASVRGLVEVHTTGPADLDG